MPETKYLVRDCSLCGLQTRHAKYTNDIMICMSCGACMASEDAPPSPINDPWLEALEGHEKRKFDINEFELGQANMSDAQKTFLRYKLKMRSGLSSDR